MKISRTKFVTIFLLSAFAFMFVSTSLLGSTGVRGFPQPPDSVLRTGSNSPQAWKRMVSTIILPIKVVLVGPMLPYVNFLHEDPPPPFIGAGFALYLTLLALLIYYLLGKIKRFQK